MAWERGRGEGVLAPQGLMLMGAYVLREARIDTSRPPTYKGAMERDENGNLLCPVCHETIHDPDRRPFMGDRRVHEHCWSSPFKQAEESVNSRASSASSPTN